MDEVAIVEDILYSQYEDSSYQDLANIPLPLWYLAGAESWTTSRAGAARNNCQSFCNGSLTCWHLVLGPTQRKQRFQINLQLC